MTFRTRIAVMTAAAVAVVIVLGALAAFAATGSTLRDEVDESLLQIAEPFLQPDRGRGPGGVVSPFDSRGPFRAPDLLRGGRFGGAPGFVQFFNANGDVVVVTGQSSAEQLPITDVARDVARGTSAQSFETVTVDGDRVRVLTLLVGDGVAAQVARPLDEVDAALASLARQLAFGGLAGVLLAWLIGQFIADRLMRPVSALTETTEDVTRTQDLSHRIEVEGQDELARLATSFNAMLESLDQARRAQQQLVADASHELRTPLTSLRTNIEVLQLEEALDPADRRRLLADVTLQLEEFGRLVGALVELARGDAPVTQPTEVRLDELVELVVARAQTFDRDATIELIAEPTTVLGQADRLERAVSNLVENAIKYAGRDGPIEVTVQPGEVAVRDHGRGIPPDDLPHVFDRFYRAPDARGMPGSGLGLSIVRQVAEAHGGEVDVEPAEGGGVVFRLRLPTARQPARVG